MTQINPYLNFPGTCEEAFNFYKSVFGGEFPFISRYKDMPPSDGEHAPQLDGEKIMHISLPLSNGGVLMGSDVDGKWNSGEGFVAGIQLSISTDSEEEAKRIFSGLSAGGKITMPLDKMFWGALFGMFIDKFGVAWMVNYDYNNHE